MHYSTFYKHGTQTLTLLILIGCIEFSSSIPTIIKTINFVI